MHLDCQTALCFTSLSVVESYRYRCRNLQRRYRRRELPRGDVENRAHPSSNHRPTPGAAESYTPAVKPNSPESEPRALAGEKKIGSRCSKTDDTRFSRRQPLAWSRVCVYPVKPLPPIAASASLAKLRSNRLSTFSNGNAVYLLTPDKSPFPSQANPVATAPLYLPLYPVTSSVPSFELNCQPSNCDHVNVLPYPSVDYGALPGTAKPCVDFNGGNPCSQVEGHDQPGGDCVHGAILTLPGTSSLWSSRTPLFSMGRSIRESRP